VIAMTLGQALQTIVSRNVDPLQAAVAVDHADPRRFRLQRDSRRGKTLRHRAGVLRRVRALDPRADARDLRRHRQRFQVEIIADIRDTFSVLVNQEEQSRVVEAVARTVVDPAKVFTRSQPKMGSEDFADMMQRCPAPISGSAMKVRCRCTIPATFSTTRSCRSAPACSRASSKPDCR
jgi:hippurate hydrolase